MFRSSTQKSRGQYSISQCQYPPNFRVTENGRRSPRTTINTLNNDVLLEVFDFYRLYNTTDESDLGWSIERWWYKPVHVCRTWRHLILRSPIRLDLHLVCTYGIPVEAMISHSPSLPLIIYYPRILGEITAADEESALFALQQRGRVRRIHVVAPTAVLCNIVKAMEGEFAVLERLVIRPQTESRVGLVLPEKLQAPLLHHLTLSNITLPTGSRLLRDAEGLITLALLDLPATAEFHPEHLVAQLSAMSHLEMMTVHFYTVIPNRKVRNAQAIHITLPRLKLLILRGCSAYLEGILSRLSAPHLATLSIEFFNQLTFDLRRLLQFVRATGEIRFRFARIHFEKEFVSVIVDPELERAGTYPFLVQVNCRPLDWQAACATQICDTLAPLLASVDSLTLGFHKDGSASWKDEIDHEKWHGLLRTFAGVTSLQLTGGLAGDLFGFLQLDEVEPPLDLLPGLEELVSRGWGHIDNAFASFISARQSAGRPIRLVRN
ncbi:hypothetical protein EDB85DRAFT_2162018 [Lactarius pseudohatsudake]|nr:hypothetical protein EDB85DRAFT_2162018 [Lactarius pseudohatsudake]